MSRGRGRATLVLESAILAIVEERNPITVRGVAYALFAEGLIRSMATNETGRVSRVMTDMRERGDLDWTLIVDGSRAVERVSTWRNPAQIIEVAVRGYRRDYWQDQHHIVEVWSEKSTVQGVLAPVLDELGVTFRVMKGFGSFTAVMQAAADSLTVGEKTPVALYLGDFDPSGLYMSDIDLPERLDRYGSAWDLRRIALTEADTATLPPFDARTKRGDVRFDWYAKHHGLKAWELDAMNPAALRARVQREITSYIDMDSWSHAVGVEQAEIESMKTFQKAWAGNLRQVSKYSPRVKP